MMQLGVVILFTRIFMTILKPFRQPRFVSEILVGIVLGPSLLSRIPWVSVYINPFEGSLLLETMGNLGVTFYMFLVGLEMDLTPIRRMGKTACSVAIAGIIVPGCAGMGLYYQVLKQRKETPHEGGFFWAIALTVTSFPDLARMLSKLKLMYTDLGKTALTSAVLTDLASWILLVATVSIVNVGTELFRIVPTVIFTAISWFVIRPLLFLIIKRIAARTDSSIEGQYSDKHVCFILSGVLLCGFITELCGVHSMFGAFMFGLMIPSGELGTKIMEKIEESVVGILLPPVFLIAGLRTNIEFISAGYSSGLVVQVILVASFVKITSTLLVCLYLKCPIRDSLALGVLMNTKGVIAIIVLNEGRNVKGFDQQTFTWMIFSILVMTASVGPIVSFTHKSARYLKQYYRRNLERSKLDEELRVLACLHSSRNISGLINLLHFSNATRKSPITVFAVHLVELTGRASAMLIFHDKSKITDIIGNNTNPTREKSEAEQIVSAFESFQKDNHAAIVQPLTAVSSYATMHEDVSNFALDKRVTVILLPFHKKSNGLGGWTDENLQHKQVSENLLANAPCSIGILVDRGLTRHLPLESQHERMRKCRVAMLFVQGHDDREALAYAWRMAGNSGLILTVVRFIPGKELVELEESAVEDDDGADSEVFSATFEKEKEKLLDDDYINEFRFRTMHDQSIAYMEKQVNSGDQIVSTIRSTYNDFDLYIVGRGYGMQSPLTLGLSEWSDCPELGVIGETLVSVDFLSSASVLVMQQSAPTSSVSKKNSASKKGVFGNGGQPSAEPFVNHRKTDDYY
ncbi:hypothetical protein CRYUN_Cryun23aG0162300 [Craigia yunnanensis]